jgi:hypothetical protein
MQKRTLGKKGDNIPDKPSVNPGFSIGSCRAPAKSLPLGPASPNDDLHLLY